MSEFNASYLQIAEDELVSFLLKESGQHNQAQVNPQDMLDYLKLNYISVDLNRELEGLSKTISTQSPRALILFHERLIASDCNLDANRTRFSVLHEIAHYIIPHHQNSLYICDKRAMGFDTQLTFEQEANRVAAELLFLADRFEIEANSLPLSAGTVKDLALKYGASFEATARRVVERSYRDCMFISFCRDSSSVVDNDSPQIWNIRYCIPSHSFRHKYFPGLSGRLSQSIVSRVTGFQDIAQNVVEDLVVGTGTEATSVVFRAEYFYNTFNVFCFLTPTIAKT